MGTAMRATTAVVTFPMRLGAVIQFTLWLPLKICKCRARALFSSLIATSPLRCTTIGFFAKKGGFGPSNVPNVQEFGDTIAILYEATGGTGNYTFYVQQIIQVFGTITYSGGITTYLGHCLYLTNNTLAKSAAAVPRDRMAVSPTPRV